MIDLTCEEVFTLPEATKFVPKLNGRKPHASTCWRWCRKGIQGINLEYVKIGGTICTSKEALSRFFNAIAEADRVSTMVVAVSLDTPTPTDAQIRSQSERSEQELIKAGM